MQTGITLHQVEGVTIADLIVQGFQVDGIAAMDGANASRSARRRVEITAATASLWAGRARSSWIPARAAATAPPNSLPTPIRKTRLRDCRLLGDTAPGWVDLGGRVYLGDTLVRGGRESIVPAASPQPAESASPQ